VTSQPKLRTALSAATVGGIAAFATLAAVADEGCKATSPNTSETSGSTGASETASDSLGYWTPERMRSATAAGYEGDC
jgi:hypothetical protein